jgi:hypothetical protein
MFAGPDADSDTLLSASLGVGCGLSVSGDRPLREGLVVEKNLGAWLELARDTCAEIGTTAGRHIEALIAVKELRDGRGLMLMLELRTNLESAPRVMIAEIVS